MSVSHISDNAYNWQNTWKSLSQQYFILTLLLVTAIGCGEKWVEVVPTTGTVKFNGTPPAGAQIALHAVNPPTDGSALSVTPTARVQNDGTFSVTSYQANDGAAPGEYIVTVEWYPVDKEGNVGTNAIPKEYANPKTSPLKVTVNGGGPTTLDPIDIKAAQAASRTARNIR